MGERRVLDTEAMESIGRQFDGAAQDLDEVGRTMPTSVDAGPLSERTAALMETVAVNAAELVMRLELTGRAVRQAARNTEETDRQGARDLERFLETTNAERTAALLDHKDPLLRGSDDFEDRAEWGR